jgi:hypothetical protein
MSKTTTGRTWLGLAAIAGFVVLVTTANCGSGGESTGSGGSGPGGNGGSGQGGSGGSLVCPTEQIYDCSNAYTLPDGHVTDFSAREWNNTSGKYCNAGGLQGSIYSYSGSGSDADGGVSAHAQSVDTTAGNLVLNLTAVPSDYAGGGLSFDHCVNVSSFNAVRFTLALASGDLTGCDLKVHLKTFEQQSSSQKPAGGCDETTSICYSFPTASLTLPLTATPQTVTIPLDDFTPPAVGLPAPQQVVGLQWQIQSAAPLDPDGGAQIGCTVELRVDDIAFVTQ